MLVDVAQPNCYEEKYGKIFNDRLLPKLFKEVLLGELDKDMKKVVKIFRKVSKIFNNRVRFGDYGTNPGFVYSFLADSGFIKGVPALQGAEEYLTELRLRQQMLICASREGN